MADYVELYDLDVENIELDLFDGNPEVLLDNMQFAGVASENDPTVPAWAKEPTKPTYNYNEIVNAPTKVSDLPNDAGYITDASLASEYAKKTWVQAQGYVTDASIAADYAKKTWVQAQGYLTEHQSLADYYNKSETNSLLSNKANVSDVPTKTSDLTNDSGFLTQHQSLANYYNKTETNTLLDGKANTSDIPTKTSQLTNDSGFLTQHQSLTNYYNKSETNTLLNNKADTSDIPTKTSELTNDSGFLTQHQSLSEYAKKTELPTKTSDLTNDSGFLTQHQSLAAYRTSSDQDVIDATKANTSDIPTKTSDLTNDSGFLTQHQSLAGYATETWVEGKGYLTQHQSLGNYYTKSETYTKEEVDAKDAVVVTITNNGSSLIADKTYNDIYNACVTKKSVWCTYQGAQYPVFSYSASTIIFLNTIVNIATDQVVTTYLQAYPNEAWGAGSWTMADTTPIIVHITDDGQGGITADHTFAELNAVVGSLTIECCYNGKHSRLVEHTNQKLEFISSDIDTSTGATTEVVIEVTNANVWTKTQSTYIPLKQDKLLYSNTAGIQVPGTVNTSYVDSDGNLTTTGSSGSWDAWNITGMNLSEFRFIRFLCVRDSANTGGTWICDVPLHVPIQTGSAGGYFVSSGQMSSFGDRNRWNVAQCGVKGDKTAVGLGQVFSLYGTAATTVSGIKICAVYGVY